MAKQKASAAQLVLQAEQLQSKIDSGKLKGEALRLAKMRVGLFSYRADKLIKAAKPAKKTVVNPHAETESAARYVKARNSDQLAKARAKILRAPKGPRIPKLIPDQGFLTGFLGQMSLVRIEELVADKIFKSIMGSKAAETVAEKNMVENSKLPDSMTITFPKQGLSKVSKKVAKKSRAKKSA